VSKVIVITGAGSGLGRALARSLAADGDTVVLLGRRLAAVEAVATELGGEAAALACDVGSPDSVSEAFARIGSRFGRIDVLINNAGIYAPFLVEEAVDEQILQSIATNLTGPILCSRAATPLMPKGSLIINVSSDTVSNRYYPFMTLYKTTKAGLEAFSENLNFELAPRGIRVAVVRAGPMFEPEMTWTIDPELTERFQKARLAQGIPSTGGAPAQFGSVPAMFRAIIDLPADLTAPLISLGGQLG
jgi:meso-butanediol dehydrogenase/(S,S)-butanediol dehydrogenase/diacetyl reductase